MFMAVDPSVAAVCNSGGGRRSGRLEGKPAGGGGSPKRRETEARQNWQVDQFTMPEVQIEITLFHIPHVAISSDPIASDPASPSTASASNRPRSCCVRSGKSPAHPCPIRGFSYTLLRTSQRGHDKAEKKVCEQPFRTGSSRRDLR